MGASKTPSRVIDGPFANWATEDEDGQVNLANGSILQLGQPLCIDVTQLGPDQNVPNNGAQLPQCERLVATTSGNAGPLFGTLVSVSGINQPGITYSIVNGIPQWKNTSGVSLIVPVQVRQLGWGYVLCGTTAIGQTGGNSILVGSNLIITSAQVFAIQGAATIAKEVGTALATAINTTETGAPLGPGVISVTPKSLVGIVPNSLVLIDAPQSGVQEQVSVGSVSYPTFSIALVNAHPAGFKITGPGVNPVVNSVLLSTPGAGVTVTGLVATWIDTQA